MTRIGSQRQDDPGTTEQAEGQHAHRTDDESERRPLSDDGQRHPDEEGRSEDGVESDGGLLAGIEAHSRT